MAQALKPLFNAIVDAIHEKDGKSDGIAAADFPTRIRAIPTGIGGVQLESIAITTPPTKTVYVVGETFDPTGMTVTATYSNGQTMYVDHSNLTFDPSGPLEEGTTYVTANFQWGLKMASASQAVSVSLFTWWSPHMTSDNAPAPYEAIASSVFNNCFAYLAFRGSDSPVDGRDCWCDVKTGVGSYIKFDFGEEKSIFGIRMMPSYAMTASYTNDFPKIFNVDGSNDGATWDTLYSADGTEAYHPTEHEWRKCMFEYIKKYRYYRVITTGVNYSDTSRYEAAIGQIEFAS